MISVVIPVVNAAQVLPAQLECMARQTYSGEWELILADNGSTDRTFTLAETWRTRLPNMRIVDASQRRGCGAAKNVGASHATGDCALFCDADDLVAATWVQAYAEALRDWSVATGPIRLFRADEPAPPFDGEFPTTPSFHLGWLPFAMGCNMGIRRSLFDELGGFDEATFPAEDVDISWRAQLAGHQLHFAAGARVLKRQVGTFRAKYRQHRSYGIADVVLRRKFRPAGLPRQPLLSATKPYVWLVLSTPLLIVPKRRLPWAGVAGRHAGRWIGTIRGFLGRRRGTPDTP